MEATLTFIQSKAVLIPGEEADPVESVLCWSVREFDVECTEKLYVLTL